MSAPDTKSALLNAAERLFAERGYAATSLREISAAAQVNLAAANYHFGSKRGLIEAVLRRRISPLNQERLRQLNALQSRPGRRPPPLEAVLEAFVGPALRLSRQAPAGGAGFVQLVGRTFIEPNEDLNRFFLDLFQEVASRFGAALRQSLPHLPPVELFWRSHFLVGALAHTMGSSHLLRTLYGEEVDPDDLEGAIARLVAFAAAGMRASLPAAKAASSKPARSAKGGAGR